MSYIYEKYLDIEKNSNAMISKIGFKNYENFNFAFDCVDEIANKNPNKTAIVWVSNEKEEKKISFLELKKNSSKIANYLKNCGIKKGDKVMLILKRHLEFWYTIIALHKIGAVVIPATNQLQKKDLVYRFNAAGVKMCICTCDDSVLDAVLESREESKTLEIIATVKGKREGLIQFNEEYEKCSEIFDRPTGEDDVNEKDIMLMYFTSGTTGYPKIAAHNYLYPLGHISTALFWHNVQPDGLHLTISDTGWAKSMWGKLYGQWLCECAVFVYDFERFNAEDILSLFAKYNITTFCAPPTMYRFFIKENMENFDLSSLKYATIAGEALNPEVFSQFKSYTGLSLMEGYGQTETTLLAANFVGTTPKPGSMGMPNPQYNIDVIDENGKSVPAGSSGEIVIRTEAEPPIGMFCGYYKDEEKTKEVWNNGIYHTGDVAWRDEDGYLWYVSRTDDLIKSSGYRIGPFEIESVLMEHPSVLECAVTGVPDEIRGQAVKATIVLAKGYTASEELKKEIQLHTKNLTAPYKYPRVVEFVEQLPKTISGKIMRKDIRTKQD